MLDCPNPAGEHGEKAPFDELEPPQITQLWSYQGAERRLLAAAATARTRGRWWSSTPS